MARTDPVDSAHSPSDSGASGKDSALQAIDRGHVLTIGCGDLSVLIAPAAGGRIAQISWRGVDWLHDYSPAHSARIAWGCYPMLPWAGRIRCGRFDFLGRAYQLPTNLGLHAIHGLGFGLPWQVQRHSARMIELSLQLPQDARWPFGGSALQRMEVGANWLRLCLSVSAGTCAMPAVIGWHPWLQKPEQLLFTPQQIYPRDAQGMATLPPIEPTRSPWDDCFINSAPVSLQRAGQSLRLSSDCVHWVVYDEPAHATCIEPQSGPPDAFNIEPCELAAGATVSRWFRWEWV